MIFALTLFLLSAGFSLCQVQFATQEIIPGSQEATTSYSFKNEAATKDDAYELGRTEKTEEIVLRDYYTTAQPKENETTEIGKLNISSTYIQSYLQSTQPNVTNYEQTTSEPPVTESTIGSTSYTKASTEKIITSSSQITEATVDPQIINETTNVPKSTKSTMTVADTSTQTGRYLESINEKATKEQSTTDILQITEAEETALSEPEKEVEVTEDFVEKQINEAINSMPKLPELVLSDNKTHFKFHKNSEEMLIDEKITQIARQLAEQSLREQYEEQKLGYLGLKKSKKPSKIIDESKPYKIKKTKISSWKPNQQLTEPKVTRTLPPDVKRFGVYKSSSQADLMLTTEKIDSQEEVYETVTNLPFILKLNKSETQIREISEMLKMKNEKPDASLQSTPPIPLTFRTGSTKRDTLTSLSLTTERSSLLINLLGKEKPKSWVARTTFYSHVAPAVNQTTLIT